MSDCLKLPFFPKHKSTFLNPEQNIRLTFFEPKFSQNSYNYQNVSTSSNACTLIVVLMASYCKFERVKINSPDKCLNRRMVYLLAYSMLDGNKIYDSLKAKGSLNFANLTVPEAIKYAGNRVKGLIEWKSMVYMDSLFQSLWGNIKSNLSEWHKTNLNADLYIILIANNRSVLFILQKDTVTLVDSHQHSKDKGAIITVALKNKFNLLCLWYSQNIGDFNGFELYELSFLYFKSSSTQKT